MKISTKLGKLFLSCAIVGLLSGPVLAGNGHGPGDGTGNDGAEPKDGSGYGPGDCSAAFSAIDNQLLLVRGGNGNGGSGDNGGHGPGDGTGSGGEGPQDGTGNGPGTGTCVNA